MPQAEEDQIIAAWNTMAATAGLPKIIKMTTARKVHLKHRLHEFSAATIIDAINSIPRSGFLVGNNDRGWCASFDFILQPSSLTKLIEGQYHHERRRPPARNGAVELLLQEAEARWGRPVIDAETAEQAKIGASHG